MAINLKDQIEKNVVGTLTTALLGVMIIVLGWFAAGAFNDIKASIGSLSEQVSQQNASIQVIQARLDGADRAQALIDAEQNRRLDRLEAHQTSGSGG